MKLRSYSVPSLIYTHFVTCHKMMGKKSQQKTMKPISSQHCSYIPGALVQLIFVLQTKQIAIQEI